MDIWPTMAAQAFPLSRFRAVLFLIVALVAFNGSYSADRFLLTPVAEAGFDLVGHWTLDEASGTRADSVGDSDLDTVNATPMVAGQVGNAASFPTASSTYLTIADNAAISTTGAGTFKISMWVKLLGKSGTQVFVSKYANTGLGEYAVYYEHAFRRFAFSTYASGSGNHYVLADALGEPALDTWYFIEVTHDGTNNRNTITVNSTYTNALTGVPQHQDTTAAFRIGAFGATPQYFANAVIDDVKFYKAPDTPTNDDLVAHWKFDEGSGTTAVDSSGNKKHGIIVNTPYSTSLPDVDFTDTHSLYFNSANSGRIVTTGLSLNNYTGFTLTGWAYPTAATSRASWFGQNDVFEFGFTDGDTLFCYTARGEASWDFDPGTFLNAWHYITCLGTETELIIYVDGVNVASDDTSGGGTYGSSGDTFSIGAGAVDGGTTGPFTGYIDDVRVYSRGLSPQEMQSLADGADEPVAAPVITSFSPADNATGVALDANLVATFSTATIATSTGAIAIYRTADDSLFENIPVTSSAITKSGAAITINPAASFAENTEYYVSIPATAFSGDGNVFYPGTTASTTWSFTTGDFTPPVLSAIAATSTASTTASITWTSSENASTKVVYGLTNAYGATTVESDTSPRLTSHSRALSGLLGCTTYHYAVVSRDAAQNAATSTDNSFTTIGCAASSTPSTATSTSLSSSTGGTTSVTEGGKTLTVSVPANATATSSSLVIQVHAIAKDPVLDELGTPASVPNSVGTVVFDVKAIINGSTILDSFDHPVTITYTYSDADITGLDEATLWLYHYHEGAWVALDSCTIDTGANTVSCTTPNFSIFGLFGSTPVAAATASNGGTLPWCSSPSAPGWNASLVDGGCGKKLSVAGTVRDSGVSQGSSVVASCERYSFTRTLRFGMAGEDVRALQRLMNCLGFTLTEKGPGAPGEETNLFVGLTRSAVTRFQETYASEILVPLNLTKATGIFAEMTRRKAHQISIE